MNISKVGHVNCVFNICADISCCNVMGYTGYLTCSISLCGSSCWPSSVLLLIALITVVRAGILMPAASVPVANTIFSSPLQCEHMWTNRTQLTAAETPSIKQIFRTNTAHSTRSARSPTPHVPLFVLTTALLRQRCSAKSKQSRRILRQLSDASLLEQLLTPHKPMIVTITTHLIRWCSENKHDKKNKT